MNRIAEDHKEKDRLEGAIVTRKEGEGEGGEGGSGEESGIGEKGGGRQEVGLLPHVMEEEKDGEDRRTEEEVDWIGSESMEEILVAGDGQKEGNMETEQQPPKRRHKVAGKEWKRRAREGKGREVNSIGEGGGGDEAKDRKRKGGLDQDPDNLVPIAKSRRVEGDRAHDRDLTAEAATQPRRTQ